MEECTVLDPRFKAYFTEEQLHNIMYRLSVLAADVTVKTEPPDEGPTMPDAAQEPPLPQLPTMSDEASPAPSETKSGKNI